MAGAPKGQPSVRGRLPLLKEYQPLLPCKFEIQKRLRIIHGNPIPWQRALIEIAPNHENPRHEIPHRSNRLYGKRAPHNPRIVAANDQCMVFVCNGIPHVIFRHGTVTQIVPRSIDRRREEQRNRHGGTKRLTDDPHMGCAFHRIELLTAPCDVRGQQRQSDPGSLPCEVRERPLRRTRSPDVHDATVELQQRFAVADAPVLRKGRQFRRVRHDESPHLQMLRDVSQPRGRASQSAEKRRHTPTRASVPIRHVGCEPLLHQTCQHAHLSDNPYATRTERNATRFPPRRHISCYIKGYVCSSTTAADTGLSV